jgi:hypothetical protein
MHARLNSRLLELEAIAEQRRAKITKAILAGAFAALSREESDAIFRVFGRLVVDRKTMREALAKCTPAEAAAVERFNAASKAATLRITGRPLSKELADAVTFRSCDVRVSRASTSRAKPPR